MALCSKGLSAIKSVWHKITDELEIVLDTVIEFTGKLKTIESNPAIELITSLIPGGAQYEAAINVAIDAITTTDTILKETNTAQKLQDLIKEVQQLAPATQNSYWFKLASLIIQTINNNTDPNNPMPENISDSLVQLKVIVNKSEAAQAA
jgi:hypothetical protein